MDEPLVAVRDATVRFGRTIALDAVNLDIRAGERIALVGESGCGKTTLLLAVGGLRRLGRGTVRRGPDLRIGLLVQDPVASLNPGWTVEEIIAEPLVDLRPRTSYAERRAAVNGALARVALASVDRGRRASELSVGQCQRIALARALVASPQLLLADEPTSALDPSVAAGVLHLMDSALSSIGAALLVASHDVLAVAPLVQRMVVLDEGRVVEDESSAVLLARPSHIATKRLVESARQLALPSAR